MSKEARALLKKINDKKNAIRGLQGQGKTQEMKDQMAELREMQEEFDMLMEMESAASLSSGFGIWFGNVPSGSRN